jgi:signal transduction histidine kinase
LEERDIHQLLENALGVLQDGLSRRRISVTKDFSPDLPLLKLDPSKIETVFNGLLSNAMEAMGEKGDTLLLRTRQRKLMSHDVEHDRDGRSGKRFRVGDQVVSVEIEDSGATIAPERLNLIFDSFFTTKEAGSGRGLGLDVTALFRAGE